MKRALVVGLLVASGLSACGGANAVIPPSAGSVASAPSMPALAAAAAGSNAPLVPASLAFYASGTAAARSVTVRLPGSAAYQLSKGCDTVAGFTLLERKRKLARYSVTPQRAGACSVRFSDGKKHGATLPIVVTTTTILLAGSSVGPHAMSAAASQGTVSAITPLSSCSAACAIAAPPSKPGSNAYTVTVYDAANGTGKILARGSVTATILAAKPNVFVAAPPRIAAVATFGTVPAGTGGTAFSPVALSLTIKDARNDAISGTYTPPVVVTDDDAVLPSLGSYLTSNGGLATRAVTVTSSSSVLMFGYGGLAIPPVHITATAASVAIGQTQFAPVVAPVAYAGTNDGNRPVPEIDLYSNVSGQPGYSGTFTLSQTGWSNAPFLRSFTPVPSGTNNNCSSFSIVQTPGTQTYTVNPIASPKPGLCTMMLTGATSTSSAPVLLTYTNPTPIHVATRHSPSRH